MKTDKFIIRTAIIIIYTVIFFPCHSKVHIRGIKLNTNELLLIFDTATLVALVHSGYIFNKEIIHKTKYPEIAMVNENSQVKAFDRGVDNNTIIETKQERRHK
ncbi:MAG: hypothetical protein LBP67_10060 [Bacteroidales bacterium]|jgi:hypothetical protein|nr:hypothetical protein [Bacteroidales bacterium]